MKFLRWLRTYWYFPLAVAGVLVAFALFGAWRRRDMTPIRAIRAELDVATAAGEARKLEAELGAARASAEVVRKYHKSINALDQRQAKQAEALKDDPAKLAAFLVRAGSGG